MGEPVPSRIPLDDRHSRRSATPGTFSPPLPAGQKIALVRRDIASANRAARLFVHMFNCRIEPGFALITWPAGAVQYVPSETEPIQLLEETGLTECGYSSSMPSPALCETASRCTETKLERWKPTAVTREQQYAGVLCGPFDQIDVDGRTFPRAGCGWKCRRQKRVRFRSPELSNQFTVLPSEVPLAR